MASAALTENNFVRTKSLARKQCRQLMEAVAAVPDVSPAEFEASLNKGLNDLLMVHYLY